MRYRHLSLAMVIFVSSCKSSLTVCKYMGHEPVSNPAPFVQLRDKERSKVETVREDKDSLLADQTAYPKKDIAFYCDGKNTFANIYGSSRAAYKFAPLTSEGDLNIYTATWKHEGTYKGGHRTYYISKDFIQKSGSSQVALFNYHSVKRILLPGEEGYEYLERYKRNRLWWSIGFYGGMAAEFTGVGIGSNPRSSSAMAASDALIFTGVCSVLTSAVFLVLNKAKNVQMAVAKHNHIIE